MRMHNKISLSHRTSDKTEQLTQEHIILLAEYNSLTILHNSIYSRLCLFVLLVFNPVSALNLNSLTALSLSLPRVYDEKVEGSDSADDACSTRLLTLLPPSRCWRGRGSSLRRKEVAHSANFE